MTRYRVLWWSLGGTLVLGQLLLPEGALRDVAYLAVGSGAVATTAWAARRRPGRHRLAEYLLLAGLASWVLGDAGWAVRGHIAGGEAFPPITDVSYVLGYGLFIAALLAYTWARSRRFDPDALIDGLIVGTVVALLFYVIFVAPVPDGAGVAPLERTIALAYLAFDVLLVVQAFYSDRLELARRAGMRLIALGFGSVLVGDVLQNLSLRYPDVGSDQGFVHTWWLVAYLLIGAAPLYRQAATDEVDAPPEPVRPLRARHITALGVALALVPAVPGIQIALDVPVTSFASISAAGVLIALVCLRIGMAAKRMARQAEQLARAAETDGLTGLANSRHFSAVLQERAQGAEERPVLVLLVALDRLTEITDALGYRVGDELLRAAAARVREAVGEAGTASRLAGDAFAVLVDAGEVRHVDAIEWAARLRRLLTATFTLSDVSISVDALVGVAVGPDDGSDGTELLERADVALSAARTRPEGVARYTGRMTSDGLLTPHLVTELSRALAEREIVVHYQPQVDVGTGTVRAVEALVRWQHPVHGLLPPAAFIPAAERTGLIRPLTLYMLDEVLTQSVEWREAGIPLRVAANLSARDLLDPAFARHVEELMARHGVERDCLELELTETMAMVDPERSLEVLRALAGLGVGLAIDDFGTGYSSLAHLQRLPVHRLKIDRSFVMSMSNDGASVAIVRSTIELARNLGLTVVAEGVEDDVTLMTLRDMGCDVAQGFGLGRPVPADQVAALVGVIEHRVPRVLREGEPNGQRIV